MSSIGRLLLGFACLISLSAPVLGLAVLNDTLPPIILIPGFGGSKLEARWVGDKKTETDCPQPKDWTLVWVDYMRVLPKPLKCTINVLELVYDPVTGKSIDKPGWEVRVKDRERIESIETLTEHIFFPYNYYGFLVQRLVEMHQYVRNVNIRGAPYDFRHAPNQLGEYFEWLKQMVEDMRRKDGPVVLICHSMGCLNTLYFLQNQSADWKEQNILRLITLGAPWGGTVKAMRSHALGLDVKIRGIDSLSFNRLARTFPSTYFLFPNEIVYEDDKLMSIKAKDSDVLLEFTARDHEQYLEKAITCEKGLKDALKIWEQTRGLLGGLEAPGVDTYCFYGTHRSTLNHTHLTEHDMSEESRYDKFGDGTVSIRSAEYCKKWSQPKVTSSMTLYAGHMDFLTRGDIVNFVIYTATGRVGNTKFPGK